MRIIIPAMEGVTHTEDNQQDEDQSARLNLPFTHGHAVIDMSVEEFQ
jgi:hypothetical protein